MAESLRHLRERLEMEPGVDQGEVRDRRMEPRIRNVVILFFFVVVAVVSGGLSRRSSLRHEKDEEDPLFHPL